MKIKITDISPKEWKALGYKDMAAPLRLGEATVRVLRGNAHRDLREVVDPDRGPVGVEYGPHSSLFLEVELVPAPGTRMSDQPRVLLTRTPDRGVRVTSVPEGFTIYADGNPLAVDDPVPLGSCLSVKVAAPAAGPTTLSMQMEIVE